MEDKTIKEQEELSDKAKINVLSLFDGMSCTQIALEKLGVGVKEYYACEVDKHAIQVTQSNYPNTIQLGDIADWRDWNLDWESVDLLTAGFPCQSWSVSGKQRGVDDSRGKLFLTLIEIFEFIKTKNKSFKFIFENVKMKSEFVKFINSQIGVQPILINSALVSAQNRVRNYWTNIANVTPPEDRKIFWGDVRRHAVNESNFYYSPKAIQWIIRHALRKQKVLSLYEDANIKMQMIEAGHHKKYSSQRFFGIPDTPSDKIREELIQEHQEFDSEFNLIYDERAGGYVISETGHLLFKSEYLGEIPLLRYITPEECELLQGVPVGYTNSVSNTQRYKMLGNGFTVDVIEHILSFIDWGRCGR